MKKNYCSVYNRKYNTFIISLLILNVKKYEIDSTKSPKLCTYFFGKFKNSCYLCSDSTAKDPVRGEESESKRRFSVVA